MYIYIYMHVYNVFGVFQANTPKGLLFRRNVFFTGISDASKSLR